MKKKSKIKGELIAITDEIIHTLKSEPVKTHSLEVTPLPSRTEVIQILQDFFKILYPGYFGHQLLTKDNVSYHIGAVLDGLADRLQDQIYLAFKHACQSQDEDCSHCENSAEQAAVTLLRCVPKIRHLLTLDVKAAFDGDPAAKGIDEVIFSYPGILAITVYRIAHEVLHLGIPLLPRMMSEYAHSKTGIDIHPGAEIGQSFFIDHGTGTVIGETAEIGDSVKIYQGVTLGALSFSRDEKGNIIKGRKRHPKIEDNVIIYSGATILGGDTVIGKGSVIGGNVWLTRSVPPYTKVTTSSSQRIIKKSGENRLQKLLD